MYCGPVRVGRDAQVGHRRGPIALMMLLVAFWGFTRQTAYQLISKHRRIWEGHYHPAWARVCVCCLGGSFAISQNHIFMERHAGHGRRSIINAYPGQRLGGGDVYNVRIVWRLLFCVFAGFRSRAIVALVLL